MTEKKKTETFLAAISYAGDVEAKRIKEEADRKAEERTAAAVKEAEEEADARSLREIARAHSREAGRLSVTETALTAEVAKAREDAAKRVLEKAARILADFTKSDGYEKYMKDAAARIAELTEGEDDRTILIREEDAHLADAIGLSSGGIPVRVSDSVVLGGMVCDCRGMVCDLSFMTELEAMKERALRELSSREEAGK